VHRDNECNVKSWLRDTRQGSHHRRVSMVEEDHEHSGRHHSPGHSGRGQDDSHGFIKSQEVHFAKDTDRVRRVGPEINWTPHALVGTCHDDTYHTFRENTLVK